MSDTQTVRDQGRALHDPVIESLPRWRGVPQDGLLYDVLGTRTRYEYLTGFVPGYPRYAAGVAFEPRLPEFDEEYFEWIDLVEAVTRARDSFTMIELGAGYGRWITRAAALMRATRGLPVRLAAVEAEPTHFAWLVEHLRANAIDPAAHALFKAAVTPDGRPVKFHVGAPDTSYGQAIAHADAPVAPPGFAPDTIPGAGSAAGPGPAETGVVWVDGVSLSAILERFPLVDLIDLDVQGAEFHVLQSAAEALVRKVRRVHVGTHGGAIERGLRKLFGVLGWICLNDFRCGATEATLYGDIKFGDGVQTWVNPRLQGA